MRLQSVGDRLWIADGPVVDFYSFPYPTRMGVARLGGGKLWIWSPIPLDSQLKEEIDSLGSPTHLVSPNKLHHLFLTEWAEAYPEAKLWGLPAVVRKRRDLHFDAALNDQPPADWEGEIDQVVFRGSLLMDEAVFFHCRSRTVLFADLIENLEGAFLRDTPGWRGWRRAVARLWRITEPHGMAPLEWRLSFVQRERARTALDKVLGWRPNRVVIAHGKWAQENGRAFIRKSFRWLLLKPPEH